MNDQVTLTRTVYCSAVEKDVYQELTYVKIPMPGKLIAGKKLVSTFCVGYPNCNKEDCELVVSKNGKVYSEPIDD